AYIEEESREKRSTGNEIVAVLEQEKESLEHKRDAAMQAMLEYRRQHGVSSFGSDHNNTMAERTSALSTSLTNAEVAAMELRAQQAAAKAALESPATIAAYVESQQFKGREFGDREYDELRTQLMQYELAVSRGSAVQGAKNPHVQALQSTIDDLR